MTITVIGHLCLDVIHPLDGPETRSYGGIFFSIATLANLLRQEDIILPVLGVGRQDYDAFVARLEAYPNVDTSGIYRFNGPTNQVELTYTGRNERRERSIDISEPVPWKRIRSAIQNTGMVLVNMISGSDITLETLDELRMATREENIPVYLDVHSLTLGITSDFVRFHRPVEAWRRWLFMLDGIHLNEEEAATLSAEPIDETGLAKHVLSLNTRAVHITRGDRGCTLFTDSHKQIQRTDIAAVDHDGRVDPTGCGDVFVAAYCAHLLRNRNILMATKFANDVAGFKAGLVGSADIDKLSRFRIQEPQTTEQAS